jgi:predicted Zn-dependent protease
MPAPPPGQDELLALAERALGHCDGEAQASARWTRTLRAGATGADVVQGIAVEVAVVRDGRTGLVATTQTDDDGLRRAASGAADLAAALAPPGASARLGDPAPGRTHDGYDAAVLALEAGAAAAAVAAGGTLRATAAKLAIASSRGVRAYEQRSTAELRVRREAGGRGLTLALAAVRPAALDPAALAAEAEALLAAGDAVAVHAGEHAVVLGPWAVAEVLRRVAPLFAGGAVQDGPLAGRFGARVVAPNVNLSDSPRYPATLPRSYDAEGVPTQPVPLVQDGVAHRAVHDSTSAAAAGAASTGHAVLPGGLVPPRPEHLVLVGGGAADLDELAAPLERGLLIATLTPANGAAMIAEGVRAIRDGRIAEPAGPLTVELDALALLGHVQALTAAQRTIPDGGVPGWRAGAIVCPALRAGGGLRVAAG